MPNFTMTVLNAGSPVSGAQVLVGETKGVLFTTNASGIATVAVTTGYIGIGSVAVFISGIKRGLFYPVIVQEGQNVNLEIGATLPT